MLAGIRTKNPAVRGRVGWNKKGCVVLHYSSGLRMLRGLLSRQIGYQLFDAVNRDLIVDREHYLAIPLNRFVDFNALAAHIGTPFECNGATLLVA
jgi:hypothetical protein